MNRDQKFALIEKWLLENELYYKINPNDEEAIEDYVFSLGSKMSQLYRMLRENDLVPQNSYQQLISLIEDSIIIARHNVMFS